jgi:hypothetical protein
MLHGTSLKHDQANSDRSDRAELEHDHGERDPGNAARTGDYPARTVHFSLKPDAHAQVTREEQEAMNRQELVCGAELADARVDVMSTACLVAIMAMKPGYHREVQRELTEVVQAHNCSAAGRAVQEYLAVLDAAAFGATTEVTPNFISPADPAARRSGAHGEQPSLLTQPAI